MLSINIIILTHLPFQHTFEFYRMECKKINLLIFVSSEINKFLHILMFQIVLLSMGLYYTNVQMSKIGTMQ